MNLRAQFGGSHQFGGYMLWPGEDVLRDVWLLGPL